MEIKLGYDKEYRTLQIDDKNVIDILKMKQIPAIDNVENMIMEKLNNPIGSPSLKELLQKKKIRTLVIIISDITRAGPFSKLLPIIVELIEDSGIKTQQIEFVIATGTHRPMNINEMKWHYGEELVNKYKFVNHDCYAKDLVSLGKLSSGNELLVNRKVVEADFLITTGVLNTHYFAGYSGGRKAILPGVCGYETIRANHSNIIYDFAKLAKLKGNKIHEEMEEAALKVGVDFNINILINDKKAPVDCVAGDIIESFYYGTKILTKIYAVKFHKLADVVFTSPGGYPKDLNFYQSQKALNNIIDLVKQDGTIVLVACCNEGVGQKQMEEVLRKAKDLDDLFKIKQQDIQIGGHRAFATGRLLKKCEIIIISNMEDDIVTDMHFTPMKSLEEAYEYVKKKHSNDFTSYIVPNGTMFFPVYEQLSSNKDTKE